MIRLLDDLERTLRRHEANHDDAAGARRALESALLFQLRAVTDGLLADLLLHEQAVAGATWWCQFLSRQDNPLCYAPSSNVQDFRSYRNGIGLRIAALDIQPITPAQLSDLSIRILGGMCGFLDEGRINSQLARLGSSYRLLLVGAHRHRADRVRRLLSQRAQPTVPDGRFIFGLIGPVSAFGRAALFVFSREFAVSPYMEPRASGFTDKARIVVRQDVLRAELELEIRRWEHEPNDGRSEIPYTVAQKMLRDSFRHGSDPSLDLDGLLRKHTSSVLVHEASHVLFDGASMSDGTHSSLWWRHAMREDLLRFAQEPRNLDAFRAEFAPFFAEMTAEPFAQMGPTLGVPTGEDGVTLQGLLDDLERDGLIFVDSNRCYFSTLYGEGQRWTL